VRFDDTGLLMQALAHRSWAAEVAGEEDNERLELLGDSVLGMVVTERIFRSFPLMAEGELAKLRAEVVSSETLAVTARRLDVGSALLLGRGEEASRGREKASLLADAMEALIGAVYLDQGWPAASDLVLRLLQADIEAAAIEPGERDFKTRLQELLAKESRAAEYEISGSGPDHERWFVARVRVGGRLLGSGEGRSKKQAEQAAARVAWKALAQAGHGAGDGGARPAGDGASARAS
jgi:ribonuclease-3